MPPVGVVRIARRRTLSARRLAAERRRPVQVCNLQADDSGVARPGARETRLEGSLAVPMLAGNDLRGVLGVAKPVAYDFSAAETALLLEVGGVIGLFTRMRDEG